MTQEEMTRKHCTRTSPFIGFLWNKGDAEAYVAQTFISRSAAESWWDQQIGFCRVLTLVREEIVICCAK